MRDEFINQQIVRVVKFSVSANRCVCVCVCVDGFQFANDVQHSLLNEENQIFREENEQNKCNRRLLNLKYTLFDRLKIL